MIVIRSAGFLAEIFIQLHEHTGTRPVVFHGFSQPTNIWIWACLSVNEIIVVDAHSDDIPSYRLDNAFPALLEHSLKLDFDGIDVTEHGHVPYFVILVRALHDWKQAVSQFITLRVCVLSQYLISFI